MKQLLTQLDARTRRAASRLDDAAVAVTAWLFAISRSMPAANAEPGFVVVRTATDVHARRPQEPSP